MLLRLLDVHTLILAAPFRLCQTYSFDVEVLL
jgi:hypothetical protein